MDWSAVDYCDVFISYHSDGTHSHPLLRQRCNAAFLQIIQFQLSFNIMNVIILFNSFHVLFSSVSAVKLINITGKSNPLKNTNIILWADETNANGSRKI